MTEHDEDGYAGTATLLVEDRELTVDVELRGHFQPIDGYYHWYGRIAVNQELTDLLGGRKTEARIRTPHAETPAVVADPDPWGRYRVTGTSTPPFPVPATLADLA
jgi:hypothetical protein